ncbi:MAG: bacillithiol biosynthesis cysteine-adding enzyme BshC [Myxococcaceae bacterium]
MAFDFFASFIQGDSAARALLPVRPLDEEAWDDAFQRAAERRPADGLVEELQRQAAELPPSKARERSLALLARAGAPVVVTGQQVGLFLGPLYTLYKAATVVARARWLSARHGRPCIPLFWLQTEDHDWAEIARAQVLLPAGRQAAFELPAETPEQARVSLAQRTLPSEVDGLTAALSDVLESLPHGTAVSSLIARHYRAGSAPGAAFAGVLAELFADEGLVLLDPRTPAMARLATPVLHRAISQHEEISAALKDRTQALAEQGFAEQVHTRPDASLAFFHPRGPAGPRYRLEAVGSSFCTPKGTLTRAELFACLEQDPLCFSTSALLRPLVQDTLLPTAAYIGGPAECAYFAQLPPLYSLFGLSLPMVAPRARFRLVDEGTRQLLERLGLRPEDADRAREEVTAQVQVRPTWLPPAQWLRARLLGPLERELEALLPHAVRLEPRLERNVRKTRNHVAYGVEKLVARLDRAALGQDRVVAQRLEQLFTALRPGGVPQERVYAFPGPAAAVGPRALVTALVEAARPLSADVRSLEL